MQIPKKDFIHKHITSITWSESESAIKKEKAKIKANGIVSCKTQTSTSRNNASKNIYDQNEEEWLDNRLHSIGKKAFINLYELMQNNTCITVDDVIKNLPEYAKCSTLSSRLSSTRSLIEQDLAVEALSCIVNSHLDKTTIQKAKKLLDGILSDVHKK